MYEIEGEREQKRVFDTDFLSRGKFIKLGCLAMRGGLI